MRATLGVGNPAVLLEDLCFDAQQAAEKALKGLLAHRGVTFPRTHAIADLLTRLEDSGVRLTETIRHSSGLTQYAVETRYPGNPEEVTPEEHAEAVALAEAVMRWVEGLLSAEPD